MAAILRAISGFHHLVEIVTVGLHRYWEIHRLARGELIETQRLIHTFIHLLLLHGIPIAVLGIGSLYRREMGAAVRE
jgi:hypothetical protein